MLVLAVLAVASPRTSSAVEMKVVTPKELWGLFDKHGIPQYPYEARRSRIEGTGLFRMYIEADGNVRTVGVMKSTGSAILDLAAAGGLYQWHAKPGRRREVDMPVRFKMSR
ncbi:MAG: energy transducer TonB [Verrucomicrobiota bacterium]|nr:energy transducer TonB [Verrucomicrobiota bacterium]